MNTYEQFKTLAQTRKRKLANNTYLVVRDDGGFGVRLHNTEVVIYYPDRIVLDSGGWQTVTTKARMNEFSPINVWSEKGVWFTSCYLETWRQSIEAPYADGITYHLEGTVTGEGTDPKATQKLRKAVNEYAKDYAQAFIAGEVPAPSGGDCWPCCMVAADGSGPMGGADHILSHLEEKYYVPSILNRMADSGMLSIMDKDYVARTWQGEQPDNGWQADLAKERIHKAVRKFCFRELGLAA